MTLRRNSLSSYDYPEHLNPFSAEHEENMKNKYFTFGRHRASFKESAINAWNIITSPTRRHRSNSLSSASREPNHDPMTVPSSAARTVPPATPSTSRTPSCEPTSTQIKQNTDESTCSQSDEEKRYVRQGAKPKKKRRAPLPPGPTPAICLQESKQPLASPVGVPSSAESFNQSEIDQRMCQATASLNAKVCITNSSLDESAATAPLAQEDECDLDHNTDAQVSGDDDPPVSPAKGSDDHVKRRNSATENIAGSSEISTLSLKELISDIIAAYPPDDNEGKLESETIPNKGLPATTIEYILRSKEYVSASTITENNVNADIQTSQMTWEESNVDVSTNTDIEDDSSVGNLRTAILVKEDDCSDDSIRSERMTPIYKGNLLPLRIEEPNEKCDIENSLLALSKSSSINNVRLQESLETLENKSMSNSKLPGYRIENHTNTLSSMNTENKTCSISMMPVSRGTCEGYSTDNLNTGSVSGGVLSTAEQNGCIANGSVDDDLDSEEDLIPENPVPPPRFRPHPTPRSKRAMLGTGENK